MTFFLGFGWESGGFRNEAGCCLAGFLLEPICDASGFDLEFEDIHGSFD